MKVKVWTLGSFFLDYTNISREGEGIGRCKNIIYHFVLTYSFANRQTNRQTEKQSDRKTNQQIDVKTDREEVRQTDRGSLE